MENDFLYKIKEVEKMIIAFIVWSLVAVLFLVIGLVDRKSEKPVGFWSNAKPWSNVKKLEVTDIRAYNNAVSTIWIVFAIVFEILGLTFLFFGQNSLVFWAVMAGVVVLIIGIMFAYVKVEGKYKLKQR